MDVEVDELSRRELLVLKEIQLMGQATDRTTATQLLNDGMIVGTKDSHGCLKLTAFGRRLLLRGSPSLWDLAS